MVTTTVHRIVSGMSYRSPFLHNAARAGTMLDGVMNNNAIGLAFGGGMAEMKKQGQVCLFLSICTVLFGFVLNFNS